MTNLKKMSGESYNPQEELVKWLKEKLPEAFTEGKIDPKKLKVTLGELVDTNNERYGLSWAGKNDCFKYIQEPTTATLKPVRNESVEFDRTENLFIEGDNLQALKVLQKSYYGQVKMIYIDPPYNTGSDSFMYPDRFQEGQEEYMERVGDKEEGHVSRDGMWQKNSEDNGHYHSNWLSMIYPRLFLARNLLNKDGVIFVSIDDHEVFNLRAVMNEIFGEENFVAQIIWERAYSPVNLKHHFSESHDYVVCYAKDKTSLPGFALRRSSEADDRYKNPDNDPRGPWKSSDFSVGPANEKNVYSIVTPSGRSVLPPSGRSWVFSKEKTQELIKENRVWFGVDGKNVPSYKRFLSEVKEGITPMTLWKHEEVGHSQDATKELKDLFDGKSYFDYPKPTTLLKRMIEICTKDDDIILDFFAGSGTTGHAVMSLNSEDDNNRRFILVQLNETCDENTEAKKDGFNTIADIAKDRIKRAGVMIKKHTKKDIDYGFKYFKLDESNFKIWRNNVANKNELIQQMYMFTDNLKVDSTQENVLYELVLKSGLDLNVSVDAKNADGKKYFVLDGGKLVVCLEDAITQPLIDAVIALKPQKVLCLDGSFRGNDQLKTNTALQMEAAQIDFRVI